MSATVYPGKVEGLIRAFASSVVKSVPVSQTPSRFQAKLGKDRLAENRPHQQKCAGVTVQRLQVCFWGKPNTTRFLGDGR